MIWPTVVLPELEMTWRMRVEEGRQARDRTPRSGLFSFQAPSGTRFVVADLQDRLKCFMPVWAV